jgi:polyhydroxyalkanoate synthesis regulator phasin
VSVTDIQSMFKDAWSAALAGASAAEQEAEKVLGRIGFTPEDVRRHARDLSTRLSSQRRELEASIDDAVRKAAARFGVPTQDEMAALSKRLDAVSERLASLETEKTEKGAR